MIDGPKFLSLSESSVPNNLMVTWCKMCTFRLVLKNKTKSCRWTQSQVVMTLFGFLSSMSNIEKILCSYVPLSSFIRKISLSPKFLKSFRINEQR